jgi:hypothetical protein
VASFFARQPPWWSGARKFHQLNKQDSKWAHWIAREIEALGHKPRVHEWEIKGGDPRRAGRRRALTNSGASAQGICVYLCSSVVES